LNELDIEFIKEKNIISQYQYKLEDLNPTRFNSVDSIFEETVNLKQVIKDYITKGFSLFEFANKDQITQESITNFSNALNLGHPYVPEIYQNLVQDVGYSQKGFNTIENSKNGKHRAFQTNNGQKLHSDGTLDKIGNVKTSLLFCTRPSSFGGETLLFNSVGAFVSVISQNLELAKPLLEENSLRRVFIGSDFEYIGPSFKIEEGEIFSRYSKDNTSDWDYGFSRVPLLKEAYTMLGNLEFIGSPYYLSFKLNEGQGILIANDKISHGRENFIDSKGYNRKMIRGLYKKVPSI
jgi:hypothetical protein